MLTKRKLLHAVLLMMPLFLNPIKLFSTEDYIVTSFDKVIVNADGLFLNQDGAILPIKSLSRTNSGYLLAHPFPLLNCPNRCDYDATRRFCPSCGCVLQNPTTDDGFPIPADDLWHPIPPR